MSVTSGVEIGEKGRVVIPSPMRQSLEWQTGTKLVAIQSKFGVSLVDRRLLHSAIAEQLAGKDLIGDLLRERRLAAAKGE